MSQTQTQTPSIRTIVLTHLVQGVAKAVTKETIRQLHPTKAACQKFTTHYAWYKGWLKKNPAEVAKFTDKAPVLPAVTLDAVEA